jgi:hypothetical protein
MWRHGIDDNSICNEEFSTGLEDEELSNFKNIVQSLDASLFWPVIDWNTLTKGVKEFVHVPSTL